MVKLLAGCWEITAGHVVKMFFMDEAEIHPPVAPVGLSHAQAGPGF